MDVLDADVLAFVVESLPPPPARVMEVGAGSGELASALEECGYGVVAVDPAGVGAVFPIPLVDLQAPDGSFDAAVAVVALHHVEPLEPSCQRLAQLLAPGAVLVVDEFDVEVFDLRAAQWWVDRHRERHPVEHSDHPAEHAGHLPEGAQPQAVRARLRAELHPLERIKRAPMPGFELEAPRRGPYLYRWDLAPDLRAAEMAAINAGQLPAVGARFIARRRA